MNHDWTTRRVYNTRWEAITSSNGGTEPGKANLFCFVFLATFVSDGHEVHLMWLRLVYSSKLGRILTSEYPYALE
jgi:hypothetical protein